jgi:hypothetical protein
MRLLLHRKGDEAQITKGVPDIFPKEGINRSQSLVNYEIERLDKMTVLQDFDRVRGQTPFMSTSQTLCPVFCTYSLPSLTYPFGIARLASSVARRWRPGPNGDVVRGKGLRN